MVHDFAKIRPEPVLEKRAMEAPPAWTLLFTGLITGIAVGVFGCFLLYLSGKIPPLQSVASADSNPVRAISASGEQQPATSAETPPEPAPDEEESAAAGAETPLDLEFYRDLPQYEVVVEATPVPITEEELEATEPPPTQSQVAIAARGRLLQIGAFQQVSSAQRQLDMLEEIGVNAFITRQSVTGRTLHLVQAGPFSNGAELNTIRSLLQRNDISSFPLDLL